MSYNAQKALASKTFATIPKNTKNWAMTNEHITWFYGRSPPKPMRYKSISIIFPILKGPKYLPYPKKSKKTFLHLADVINLIL